MGTSELILFAPARIAFRISNPRRFLLGDSSLFSPVGVYPDCSFAGNHIFPRWGFPILLLSCGSPCVFKSKKRQYIYKMTRRYSHSHKNIQYMNIKKKYVGFKNNIKNDCLIFQYNIQAYPMLGIGYVSVIQIPCSCSAC